MREQSHYYSLKQTKRVRGGEMKSMKKKLSSLLVLVLVVSLLVPSFAFAEETTEPFTDVTKDNPNYDAILDLASIGVLNGYGDKTFKPDNPITRAEFAKVLVYALDMQNAANSMKGVKPAFKDYIDPWAWGYVNFSAASKFVVGNPNGTFAPKGNITYGQVVAILVRALGYDNVNEKRTPWYAGYFEIAVNQQIVKKSIENGNAPATRGDVAAFVKNFMKVKIDSVLGKINFEDTVNNTTARVFEKNYGLVDVTPSKDGVVGTLVVNEKGFAKKLNYWGDGTGLNPGDAVRIFGRTYPSTSADRVNNLNKKADDVAVGTLVQGYNHDRIEQQTGAGDDNLVALDINGERKEFNIKYLDPVKGNKDLLKPENEGKVTVALLKNVDGKWTSAYDLTFAPQYSFDGIVEKLSETNLFGNKVQRFTVNGKEYIVKREIKTGPDAFTPEFRRFADPEVAADVYNQGKLYKGPIVNFTDIKVGDYVQVKLDSKNNFVEKIWALGITHKGYIEAFNPGSSAAVNDYGTGAYMKVRIDLNGDGNYETTKEFYSNILDKVTVTKNGAAAALKNLSAGMNVTLTWDTKTFRLAKIDAVTATVSADGVWYSGLNGKNQLTYTTATGGVETVALTPNTSWKVTTVYGDVYTGSGTTPPAQVGSLNEAYKLYIELNRVTNANGITTKEATKVIATANTVSGFVNGYSANPNAYNYVTLTNGSTYTIKSDVYSSILSVAQPADSTTVAILQLNKFNEVTAIAKKTNTVSGIVTANDAATYTVVVNGQSYQLVKPNLPAQEPGTSINASYMESANGPILSSNDFAGIKTNAYISLTINKSGRVVSAKSDLKVYEGSIDSLSAGASNQQIDLSNTGAFTLANDVVISDQNGNKLAFENLVVGDTAQIYVNGSDKVYMIVVYR